MKKYLIVLISFICCLSCISQKREIRAKSSIKLEGKNIDINELIQINGFYYYPNFEKNENIIFFQDGTFINFLSRRKLDNNHIIINLSDYADYMEYKGQKALIGYRGVFSIKQDTIIAHVYTRPSLLVGWSLDEEKYKIINKESMKKDY